ncbi:MAG TPA: hypothetical protein VMS18_14885 [Candidatus Binatia bacterium]|nr:hypothetical protein [Candidatus Binatia bacterium]
MHTKDAPPGKPPFAFVLDKFLDPFGLDEFQVFDFAHAVSRPIAVIEMPEAIARKFGACTAEPAGAFAANTYGTFDTCFWSILIGKVAPRAGIVSSQMGLADGAIHATGGDEFEIKFFPRHLQGNRNL